MSNKQTAAMLDKKLDEKTAHTMMYFIKEGFILQYIMTAARLWEMARQLWERRKVNPKGLFLVTVSFML